LVYCGVGRVFVGIIDPQYCCRRGNSLWEGQTKASMAISSTSRQTSAARSAAADLRQTRRRVARDDGDFHRDVRGMEFARIDFHVDDDLGGVAG
jgi:hypothetical protein